jgi:hypothetical protein
MSSISNISVNTTPAPLDPGIQTQQAGNAQKTDTSLTVSVSMDVTRSDGTTQRIALELPMIAPADIDFTELEQLLESQLGMLSNFPWDAMGQSAATEMLKSAMGNVAQAITQGGVEFMRENQQALVETFTAMEQQAGATIGYYTELLNSGTYPDHTEFLKLMLKTAQDLRELASNAKQAAVQGEFDNVLEQAKKMKAAAEEDYNSAMETIKSENMAAGFQVGGALIGALVARRVGDAGGAAIGQLISTISSGTGTLAGTAWKTNAAVDEQDAGLLRAGIKALEAAQKMEQASHEAAGELNDIAKALKDFLLGMIKDFNSQQYQVVQRANV